MFMRPNKHVIEHSQQKYRTGHRTYLREPPRTSEYIIPDLPPKTPPKTPPALTAVRGFFTSFGVGSFSGGAWVNQFSEGLDSCKNPCERGQICERWYAVNRGGAKSRGGVGGPGGSGQREPCPAADTLAMHQALRPACPLSCRAHWADRAR